MTDVLFFVVLPFGGIAGLIGGIEIVSWHERKKVSNQIRARLGCESYLNAKDIYLECRGLNRWVIQKMVLFSEHQGFFAQNTVLFPWNIGLAKRKQALQKSGLKDVVTTRGIYYSRFVLSVAGMIGGCVSGALLSDALACLFAFLFFFLGFTLPDRALKTECLLRTQCAERQLSQMVEVIILGLQSGLSFDRSAKLYTHYFEGNLKESFQKVQSQWEHGLLERSEALRNLADTYDSPLLSRAVESINRSLRFGSSLSESLSLIAAEARSVRKTTLEERIAKAPVKMLLPVGTLILPAMLILIMGPILLDLMSGM